ncbi:bifunctional 2-C-methyl-D-erythritol 4-phosphate cytidylyltransferase/2-C-methyl-D-erythritol 2,4-cyclodiphosphate synthase [Palleronia sp. KMU-117]|uniref:bifunctional 2-C-methyl-D-erythritol 4-phosphate cytidylyltransferase/2-C-methyl-D-erythritol 2,4-cyclodiphosphate synthase n=1 Tax=Palleronia sp. KMU-117 TaxID=3434108 RepID=UPI003D71FE4C
MTNAAVIVAAGRGLRAGGGVPKQWRDLGGRPVAVRTLDAFRDHPGIERIVLVLHPDDMDRAPAFADPPAVTVVTGGATRRDSVLAGLEALEGQGIARVLIHDVARPLTRAATITAVLAAIDTGPGSARGAAPALAVTDALWRGQGGEVTGAVARDGLCRAQTPQGFPYDAILAAHRAHPGEAADDVEVARAAGIAVAIVPGEERNLKITTPEDFARAATFLGGTMDIRTGNGFDVHAFGPGGHVTLCGVRLPFDRGLEGHSDADVGMHALTDAIYGALAMGDIGRHFPPSDPQWKGAASHIFLAHAADLARTEGFTLTHCDVTLICERPKIGPHAVEMQGELSRIMGVDPARVSVKATTSERLGFTGRGEGIAALATATLVRA